MKDGTATWQVPESGAKYVASTGWSIVLSDDGGWAVAAPSGCCVAWRPDRESAMVEADRLHAEGFWK